MAQILKFYDEKHIYELDGEQIPSVSELSRFASREIYGDIAQYTLDHAADRGSKVHKQCELLDKYGEFECSSDIAPYIRAYIKFLEDYKPEWVAIEKPLACKDAGFAGTLDRVGKVKDKGNAIVDIKSSSVVQKVLANIQLNGYKILWENNENPEIDTLLILHLRKDETYKLIEIPIDTTLFESCLNLHNALKKKKRGKKKDE